MITIEQMVQREVLCCMSSLISTLSNRDKYPHEYADIAGDLGGLIDQASELAASVLDYEEAATQADAIETRGYWHFRNDPKEDAKCITAEGFCVAHDIDAYEWEIYEFWAISEWLAAHLISRGERVDTDFAGLNIWARTTTGQAISMDGCIQRIYADIMAPHTLDSFAPGS